MATSKSKILKAILLAAVLSIAALAVVIAMQPADYRVQRTATMAAPPEVVFAHVNDFHKWNDWSPWAKIDPNCKYTIEGSPAGKGAIFTWDGNHEVGSGKMTIAESRTNEIILINMHFLKPMEGIATTEFTFKPDNNQTNQTVVTWTMFGKNNFIGRAMCMVMNMDTMVGGQFEKGLA